MGPAMRRKGGRRRCVRKRVSMVMVRENSALVRFPAARAQIAMFSFLYRYLCAGPVSSGFEMKTLPVNVKMCLCVSPSPDALRAEDTASENRARAGTGVRRTCRPRS